ncbi:MAG: sugar phosphate isomerase [Desulfobulbaceae bacterium BRH_c16a]|nr:MAG: sugar phosphate isomerase [Desulfobulbaceae bacterium BRH_c16a]
MKFGAMNFPIIPVLEEIDSIARLGFDYLELAMDPPMAHHSIISANQSAIATALKDNDLGLVCHLPTFVSTADLTESLRRASVTEMRQSLDVAFALGAEKVVLHPSIAGGMGAFVLATAKGYAFDFLAEMVEAARQLNITICLENMFPRNLLGVLPDDFQEIFTVFPSLKFTLDTGHANIDGQQDGRLMRLAERFGDRIGHLHFSDNHGKRDDHLAIGKGIIDFPGLVRHLKKIGYDDTLTLEVFDKDRRLLVESRERIKSLFAH